VKSVSCSHAPAKLEEWPAADYDFAVPLKITGPAENPSVTLDYPRLTLGLNTPEEKRRALAETLKEQWQWLKQSRTLSDGLRHTP
jgi:hypothetical protein